MAEEIDMGPHVRSGLLGGIDTTVWSADFDDRVTYSRIVLYKTLWQTICEKLIGKHRAHIDRFRRR